MLWQAQFTVCERVQSGSSGIDRVNRLDADNPLRARQHTIVVKLVLRLSAIPKLDGFKRQPFRDC